MLFRNFFLLFLAVLFIYLNACKPSYHTIALTNPSIEKANHLSKDVLVNWHLKDVEKDSLPGISLDRAYIELLNNRKGDTIIVAVLDSEININRQELKEFIWINKNEIPDNGIDDDNNGYIDDIHGWNYIGTKENDSVVFSSFAFTRVIAKYEAKFKNSSRESLTEDEKKDYDTYKRALIAFDKELEYRKSNIAKYNRIQGKFNKATEIVNRYFSTTAYDEARLDSLETAVTDEEEKKYISYMKYYIKHDINNNTIGKGLYSEEKIINQNLNLNHNGKYHTNDNPDDLTDVPYGNNHVDGIANFYHGTEMASIIASKMDTINSSVRGILDKAKIMCVNTSTAGDEYDKDIALAIRYAVDNGAKVINMSFGKAFSLHPQWVKEAILYAESKNVLIVTSAGNDATNLDQDYVYPNDAVEGKEYANNFLKVGATTYKLDSTLLYKSSNYGNRDVDVFAPGYKINSLTWNESTLVYGTSSASAVVSGVAALIFSYYPDLTASQVKQIIMESGLSIDLMVNKPSETKEKEKVPFNTLSKSGKLVNAYNALIMADSVASMAKKRKKH